MGGDVADVAQVAGHSHQQHGGVTHTAGQVDVERVTGLNLLHNILDGLGLGALVHAVGHGDGDKAVRRDPGCGQDLLPEVVQGRNILAAVRRGHAGGIADAGAAEGQDRIGAALLLLLQLIQDCLVGLRAAVGTVFDVWLIGTHKEQKDIAHDLLLTIKG